jgi:hypothetical protein
MAQDIARELRNYVVWATLAIPASFLVGYWTSFMGVVSGSPMPARVVISLGLGLITGFVVLIAFVLVAKAVHEPAASSRFRGGVSFDVDVVGVERAAVLWKMDRGAVRAFCPIQGHDSHRLLFVEAGGGAESVDFIGHGREYNTFRCPAGYGHAVRLDGRPQFDRIRYEQIREEAARQLGPH